MQPRSLGDAGGRSRGASGDRRWRAGKRCWCSSAGVFLLLDGWTVLCWTVLCCWCHSRPSYSSGRVDRSVSGLCCVVLLDRVPFPADLQQWIDP
jgi:hypothetical protein